ncbi:beta-galactosidase [Haloferula luteola]|uniref:Beta-galactosidase n=2 Tax=Haloferula luteola TaxID=595692 RepID=A0A840VDU5_9BACT|nr:beta-galactosidase [Haloferula luteola]
MKIGMIGWWVSALGAVGLAFGGTEEGALMTRWGKELTVEAPGWSSHPRPGFRREDWGSLNGEWDYCISKEGIAVPEVWSGKIRVPYGPESVLSGVHREIEPGDFLWYRKEFSIDKHEGKKVVLHFDAVDYETKVWLNGQEVGSHVGGFTPFAVDLSEALTDERNVLWVRVTDGTGGYQLRGKQSLTPKGITYSRVSGIWQTVWWEQLPETCLEGMDYWTEPWVGEVDDGKAPSAKLRISPQIIGSAAGASEVRVKVRLEGEVVAQGNGTDEVSLRIEDAEWWSPDHPVLYDLQIELLNARGEVVDEVASYVGLRTVEKRLNGQGREAIFLNGKEIFLYGPLDQGWWPESLLTPPSEEAMVADLQFVKDAGFNFVRKHVKVEPSLYYWHCDRLGIVVWQDQVNAGMWSGSPPEEISPPWTRLDDDPVDGNWPDAAHAQWVTEYQAMVDHLRDHPAIFVWCPFNESWGQHRSMEVGAMAKAYDPSRLICLASGGNFWPVGDIASAHNYPVPQMPGFSEKFEGMIQVAGEMGGMGLVLPGHLWTSEKGLPWSHQNSESLEDWKSRYLQIVRKVATLRKSSLSAAVYTQLSDVEHEVNGFLSYDRVPKVDAAWLRKVHRELLPELGRVERSAQSE